MKLRSLRVERHPKLMIIPMIDIIFFLLVFFMMSTLYMVEQKTIPLNLPQAASAQSDLIKQVGISITPQGKIFVDQEEVTVAMLSARIRAELDRSAETLFVIRGDKQAEYGKVVTVLDELKKCGVRRISIAAEAQ